MLLYSGAKVVGFEFDLLKNVYIVQKRYGSLKEVDYALKSCYFCRTSVTQLSELYQLQQLGIWCLEFGI